MNLLLSSSWSGAPIHSYVLPPQPPQADNSDSNVNKSAPDKPALEFLHGELFPEKDTELAEINVRSYVLQELESMYKEHVVSARPTIVEDETGNSVQVYKDRVH